MFIMKDITEPVLEWPWKNNNNHFVVIIRGYNLQNPSNHFVVLVVCNEVSSPSSYTQLNLNHAQMENMFSVFI